MLRGKTDTRPEGLSPTAGWHKPRAASVDEKFFTKCVAILVMSAKVADRELVHVLDIQQSLPSTSTSYKVAFD